MIIFSANVICFGILICIITLGISVASEKGAILYYLKKKLVDLYFSIPRRIKVNGVKVWSRNSREFYINLINKYDRENRRSSGPKRAMYTRAIALCKYKLWTIRFFAKPIILCPKCMPSFWGSVLFFLIPIEVSLMDLFLSVCFASIVNAILSNYVLDN